MLPNLDVNDPKYYNKSIDYLDLHRLQLTAQDMQTLVSFLEHHPEIRRVSVSDNAIGDEGARILAACHTLLLLNVSQNNIKDEGARALAANKTLRVLNAQTNGIGRIGAIALAANTTLEHLDVCENNIGDEGAVLLAANQTLKTLHADGNRLHGAGYAAIHEENPTKRARYVKAFGYPVNLPSLHQMCLFKIHTTNNSEVTQYRESKYGKKLLAMHDDFACMRAAKCYNS